MSMIRPLKPFASGHAMLIAALNVLAESIADGRAYDPDPTERAFIKHARGLVADCLEGVGHDNDERGPDTILLTIRIEYANDELPAFWGSTMVARETMALNVARFALLDILPAP